MEVLALHHNKKYLDSCAEVLNEEWARSKAARLHSLEKSCDDLPTCLILVNKQRHLIGHSRLSQIRGREKSCLVESVVVRKKDRGKGFGCHLMSETERYAKSQGFQTMYLTTHDKQMFYSRLGYQYCEPVISFGGDFKNLPESFTKAFSSLSGSDNKHRTPESSPHIELTSDLTITVKTHSIKEAPTPVQNNCQQSIMERPTPVQNNCQQDRNDSETEEHQNKTSTSVPAAPSIPAPPPVPPGPPSGTPYASVPLKQKVPIVRWDPSKVSWMKKEL